MADVDGVWDCKAMTPMGEQAFALTVASSGDSFTGSVGGALGSMDIANGRIVDNTLSWGMEITMPFPMRLDCSATVDGDNLKGGITVGAFGTSPMTGARRA